MTHEAHIDPRPAPDFRLNTEIPKYWFAGDPFKTRLCDALSLIFPEGEKFFVTSVREYRSEITDPELARQVKDFSFQEGQHSMVHRKYNEHLAAQGIDVVGTDAEFKYIFDKMREYFPRWGPLATTAVIEHFTATFAYVFLESPKQFAGMDERLESMFAWHCIEEFEHKAVAFDVLKNVAKVGYIGRTAALMWVTVTLQWHIYVIMRRMFNVDGLKGPERAKVWKDGRRWLYGKDGPFFKFVPIFLRYLKPGFHPSELDDPQAYQTWVSTYERSGNAIEAGRQAILVAA